MPAYSSPAQVRQKLTGRPDAPEGSSAATLGDDLLNEHIADADRQIDAALNERYAVPFETVPDLVSDISADIAGWLATTAFRQAQTIRPEDPVHLRYLRALSLLKALSEGKSSLPGVTDGGGDAMAGGGAVLVNQYPHDLFSSDVMAGLTVYARDDDLLLPGSAGYGDAGTYG